MNRKTRPPLADRVAGAAERALAAQHHVNPIDVMLGLGWLYPGAPKEWQTGRHACLEEVIQVDPRRLAEALRLLQHWAESKGLVANEITYLARTPQREALRFSRSGDPAIERLYRLQWISPALPGKQRERLAEQASRPPELVVIRPLNSDWTCHRCGKSGDLLIMEQPGPTCLRCTGLDDLELLPAGDALLTRRAKAKSSRMAVVVRFSRSRKRYERQGLLVEAKALADAQREIAAEAEKKGTRREKG